MTKQIVFFILLALALRILFIFQGALSFHYDMARDAYAAKQIWQGDLKIQGPPTSTPGLYHGPLYYYLLAPFYGWGGGDPRVPAFFLAFLNSLTVIPIMLLAKDLFKSTKLALLGGFLFAISFESFQYGPWLSNPSPAYLTVALFFVFLRSWQKGKISGLYLATVAALVSAQFQFFLIYLLFLIPVFGYLFKIKTYFKQKFIAIFITLFGLSPFFIAALKFHTFQNITGGFLSIATAGQIDFRSQFSELALNYLDKFSEIFIYNFFPTNVFLGGLLALASLIFLKKQKIILFFLFFNLPIFIFGGHSNTYANLGLVVGAILAVLNLTATIPKSTKILLIFLIISSNLFAIFKNGPLGQIILVIPNDMVLKSELKLIDETYQKAAGQPFSINTLTLPLWTNTTWNYLYSWYGQKKYGYAPKFLGHNQVGLPGANDLEKIDQPLEKTFFIIEPHVGIPDDIFNLEIGAEDSKTDLIEETKYGDLKLQFRKPKNE
ncbi:hypothetical protein HYU96_01285 [Candidatus Daviesbacteria bacterium]|nr:hypothetical protein [Candidatus Daviesbacteria bacterium]